MHHPLIHTAVAAAASLLAASAFAQSQNVLPDIARGSIAVKLQTVATGLSAPDYATFAPGDASRLYVVEQNGLLRVLHNGVLQADPVLDMRSLVAPPLNPANANDERGFLGLAFHPGFANPMSAGYGTFYTYASMALGTAPTYAAPNNANQAYKNVVSEWKMNLATNKVDANSPRRDLISFGKNAGNHNGGTIAFGPDNYLYLGLGDGGNANDAGASHIEPGGNAQNLSTPLGKMLRVDPLAPGLTAGSADAVSANGQYRIPVSNPFLGTAGAVPETFAYGFRNPYRFAFDRTDLGGHGDLILADVGQNTVEEIDRVVIGGNYGWAVKEGDFVFYRTDPDGAGPLTAGSVGPRQPGTSGLIDPIKGTLGTLEYDHGDGISITGGFVYRGQAIPQLYGKYVFGDLALRVTTATPRVQVDGRLFYADLATGVIQEFQLPEFADGRLPNGLTVHGFGEDAAGELYALATNTSANGNGGIVYQITAVPEPGTWALYAAGLLALGGLRRRRG